MGMMQALPLDTEEGRQAWAFIIVVFGCCILLALVAVSLYLTRGNMAYAFWHGMAAHAQLFFLASLFGWVLGRRMQAKANKDGVAMDDRDPSKIKPGASSMMDGYATYPPMQQYPSYGQDYVPMPPVDEMPLEE